ncbi:PF06634 family protein [Leptospira weilii serovar Ranarum str. ICFT]|uniref:PF06634 family protein n=1 Tax=Leptospira weilii serovar Ranarum str. ICFT TaxID=1218598 RepID=N1WA08_9LEPT|nr:DNA methyltransferase [Leptospira weilii]EMY77061.1 PF06634 family protein [Leptospira weilii serovar Ranarum str. ICFT]
MKTIKIIPEFNCDLEKLINEKNTLQIEKEFPFIELSQLAERESWRKELNRPIYHIHKWWATRLGSVFRGIVLGSISQSKKSIWSEFYNIHNFSNKIVLDPFMGSGTTIGEALKLGSKAIGCDINPISTFSVTQALIKVQEQELLETFVQIERKVSHEIKKYYITQKENTNEELQVLHFFWVKIAETPEGESIPLFDNYIFSKNAYPKKKPDAQIICPNCWQISKNRYDTEKLCCRYCSYEFNPQNGTVQGQYVVTRQGKRYKILSLLKDGKPFEERMYAKLVLNTNGEKEYLPISDFDLELYNEAKERLQKENLPLPIYKVRPGYNTNQAKNYNYNQWKEFFNDRQLLCLGMLLRTILEIKNKVLRYHFLILFSGILEFNNKFCSFKGEGTGAVRHMFSHHILKPERTPLENNIWGNSKGSGSFSSMFYSRLLRAKKYLSEPFDLFLEKDLFGKIQDASKKIVSYPIDCELAIDWEDFVDKDKAALIMNGSSMSLNLPNHCVDAIVTDPPYFDFVHYSELSDFFYAWLSPVLKADFNYFDKEDSSNISEVQNSDPFEFAKQLTQVFRECNRVLKNEGVMVFSFHHSKPEGWVAIMEAVTSAGFKIVNAHPVYAEFKGSSPKSTSKNPISLDAILVCKKNLSFQTEDETNSIDEKALTYKAQFENSGFSLSKGDLFVLYASQYMLQVSSFQKERFDLLNDLYEIYERIFT